MKRIILAILITITMVFPNVVSADSIVKVIDVTIDCSTTLPSWFGPVPIFFSLIANTENSGSGHHPAGITTSLATGSGILVTGVSQYEFSVLVPESTYLYIDIHGGWSGVNPENHNEPVFTAYNAIPNTPAFAEYNGHNIGWDEWCYIYGTIWVSLAGLEPGGAVSGRYDWVFGSAAGGINATWEVSMSDPVPEPTTFLLFGTGLAGLAVIGRRKRR